MNDYDNEIATQPSPSSSLTVGLRGPSCWFPQGRCLILAGR